MISIPVIDKCWVVVTDSRKRDEYLFMVDRSVQTKSFWSNQLVDAFIYRDFEAAKVKANSLKYNNPRVVTLTEAISMEIENFKPYDIYNYDFGHQHASGIDGVGHGQT